VCLPVIFMFIYIYIGSPARSRLSRSAVALILPPFQNGFCESFLFPIMSLSYVPLLINPSQLKKQCILHLLILKMLFLPPITVLYGSSSIILDWQDASLTGFENFMLIWSILSYMMDNCQRNSVLSQGFSLVTLYPQHYGTFSSQHFLCQRTLQMPHSLVVSFPILNMQMNNFLILNPSKSNVMIFGPIPPSPHSFYINNVPLPFTDSIKYIGVTFKSTTWDYFSLHYLLATATTVGNWGRFDGQDWTGR